jgi:hypothetical protein
MIGQVSVAAATAVAGYDLFQNERWNVSSKRRVLRGIAAVGSAAINDCSFDLYVESAYIGRFYNTHAGVVAPIQEDIIALGAIYVPPGSKVSAIVAVGATTNPINVILY